MKFLIKKEKEKISAVFFLLKFFVIKTLDPVWICIHLICWIRIHTSVKPCVWVNHHPAGPEWGAGRDSNLELLLSSRAHLSLSYAAPAVQITDSFY